MPDVIPFTDLAGLDNKVFQAAGVSPKPAAPAEIPFSDVSLPKAPLAPAESAPSGEIPLADVGEVDTFYSRPAAELYQDKKFDPRAYFASNPDVAKDPAQLQKLLDVYRYRREQGITPGVLKEAAKAALPTAGKFAKGAYRLASNVFEFSGLQPLFNKAASVVTGDAFDEQRSEALEKESENRRKAALSEFQAGTELSATGLADLGRTGVRKVLGKSPSEMTDQELLADLSEDIAFQGQLEQVREGRGESLKNAGIDADTLAKEGVTLDPDAIENLSLVDPATVIATAAGFKIVGAAGRELATVPFRNAGARAVAAGLEGEAKTAAQQAIAASEREAAKAAAEKVAQKLNDYAKKGIGKGVETAGQALEKTSAAVGKVAEAIPAKSLGTVLGGTQTGTLSGAAVGAAAGEAGKRVIKGAAAAGERRGAAIADVGRQIAGTTPRSATVSAIIGGVKSAPVKGAVAGTAAGLAAAAPLALATDDDTSAGAILGGGAALGATAGTAFGAKRAIGESIAKKTFDPHGVQLPVVDSPAYGIDPALDAAHAKQLPALSPAEQGAVTTFREAFRALGGEIYALDAAEFKNRLTEEAVRTKGGPLTPEETAAIDSAGTHLGYFDAYVPGPDGTTRRVVLLNGSAKAIPHESGHLLYSLVSPSGQESLRASVREVYSPEQIAQFKARYEQRLGSTITEEMAINELIAENFSALMNNVPVSDLNTPRPLLSQFAQAIGEAGEILGIDLTSGRATPDLKAPVSFRLRRAFQDAVATLPELNKPASPPPAAPAAPAAPAPAPAPTPAPAPPARPTRPKATPTASDAAARRAKETGITEAKRLAADSGDATTIARVNEVSASMEGGNPVLEIDHLGIASQGTEAAGAGRTPRRGEQATGYQALEALRIENRANAPADIVNLHQKTFIPVRWTDQGGTPTLVAMSVDKVISNIHRIVREAANKGLADRIPYATEQGRLTEAGWQEALKDFQAYAENQANGFRGDGLRLTRPTEEVGLSIPAENPDYRPTLLDENKGNFLNLVQGLATPETAREVGGVVPGNIKAQTLAEANKRPLLEPAEIKPRNAGKQEFKSFPGRTVKEVNPLRNELAKAGVPVRELIEVTERIRAKDIAGVKPRADIDLRAPVTDIVRGGFLPEELNSILGMTPEEWSKWTADRGGLTGHAFRLGSLLEKPIELEQLRLLERDATIRANEARLAKDLDNWSLAATKKQFFTEAIQAAEGTANPEVTKRILGENYKPPFPKAQAKGQFLPGDNIIKLSEERPALDEIKRIGRQVVRQPDKVLERLKEGAGKIVDKVERAANELSNKLDEAVTVAPARRRAERENAEFRAKFVAERDAENAAAGIEPTNIIRDIKFLPADQIDASKDPIQSAAIRTKNGTIFTGSWHGEAMDKFVREVANSGFEDRLKLGDLEDVKDGFVTTSGKFLNREEAAKHAEAIGQIAASSKSAKEGQLEADQFRGERKFLPKETAERVKVFQKDIEDASKRMAEIRKSVPAEEKRPISRALEDLDNTIFSIRTESKGRHDDLVRLSQMASRAADYYRNTANLNEEVLGILNDLQIRGHDFIDKGRPTLSGLDALGAARLSHEDAENFRRALQERFDLSVPDASYVVEKVFSDLRADVPEYLKASASRRTPSPRLDAALGSFRKASLTEGDLREFINGKTLRKISNREALPADLGERTKFVSDEIQKVIDLLPKLNAIAVKHADRLNLGSIPMDDLKNDFGFLKTDLKFAKDEVNRFPKPEEALSEIETSIRQILDYTQSRSHDGPGWEDLIDRLRDLHSLTYDADPSTRRQLGGSPTGLEHIGAGEFTPQEALLFRRELQERMQIPLNEASYVATQVLKDAGKGTPGYRGSVGHIDLEAEASRRTPTARGEAALAAFRKNNISTVAEIREWINGRTIRSIVAPERESGALPAPSPEIQDLAAAYVATTGRKYSPATDYVPVNAGLGRRLADFYEKAQSKPQDKAVRASYDALIRETDAQGRAIINAGYKVEPYKGSGEPYKNSAEMLTDVRDNKHLYYLQTGEVFGNTPAETQSNLMLARSREFPDQPANDVFRWVHDFFGHAKEGYQFGPRGELNAWRAHSQMYSPEAQGALAAETLAQNSWVNFGPQAEGKSLKDRPFGEQKNTIVPANLIAEALGTQAPEIQFLPRRRDDRGNPLTKEGLLDIDAIMKDLRARERRPAPRAVDLEKYNAPGETVSSEGITGWILPSREFVALPTAFHEQYLARNASDLNERFGTSFSNKPNLDARLDAVNRGFVRVRYEPNKGVLNIEVAASKWDPATKRAVLNHLLDHEGAIDNLNVSLLNPDGSIADSVSEKLFNADNKVAAITDAVNSLRKRGGAALPGELPGFETAEELPATTHVARRIARAKEETPEAITPKFVREEDGSLVLDDKGQPRKAALDYDLASSPLAKEAAKGTKKGDERDAAIAKALGKKLVSAYRDAVKDPTIEAGAKWYSTARTRLKKLLGEDAKFFAELLGATSARTPVEVNFRFAVDAYNRFKAGEYDTILEKYREGKRRFDEGDIADYVKATDKKEPNRGQFLDWWVEEHDLAPRQSNGKKFGANSRHVLKVLDGTWLKEVQGPKTPNFMGNLTGDTFEATIDVWAARLLHRLAHEGSEKPWRILPENETGVSDADFYMGQAAYRAAAEKLGMKPDALQAILWFYEKAYWEKQGWTRGAGAEKSDFNSLLKATEKTKEGKLRTKKPQVELELE